MKAHFSLLAFLLFLLSLPSSLAYTTVSSCSQITPPGGYTCREITQCGTYTQSNSYFLLMNSVTSDRSCLVLSGNNYIVDINGYTMTYSDMDFTGVQNPGFEEGYPGDPKIPIGWDLSNAPHAYRQNYTEKLYFGNYSLRINNIAGDAYTEEYVLSSPVYLPSAGRYAVFTQIQGGPYNKFLATINVEGVNVTCNNVRSSMSTQYVGDMSWGLICEFNISQPSTVRAKINVAGNETVNVSVSIDEADIRPIGDRWGDGGIRQDTWNRYGQEVKNGRIIQGRSKAIYSPGLNALPNSRIHDLEIITNGMNSQDIDGTWVSNSTVYNNYMEANGKLPLNRQYFFAMVDFSRTEGGVFIYNNTLMNGPHVGILGSDSTGGVVNPLKSEIYNNTIKTRITATNGFSITFATNTDIHDNIIQPFQGHGIGAGPYQRIYNNLIEPRSWPCSEYAAYSYPNSAHGIRIKTYGSGYMINLSIFNNTIIGKTNPQLPNCYTEVSGITNYITDDDPITPPNPQNNEIYNNNISVETDNYLQQHAIAYKNGGDFANVHDNIFKSNHIIVEMSDSDSDGGKNTKLISNMLVKGENPSGFRTLRYGYFAVFNNTFMDTKLLNGADLKDIYQTRTYSTPVDLTVSWYLQIQVKDNSGMPVDGAQVTLNDKNNNLAAQAITNSSGSAAFELKEYVYSYGSTASYSYYTPYTATAEKSGKTNTTSITMNASKNVDIILDITSPCIHKSDNNPCDGCVSDTELFAFIDLWKQNSSNPTLKELIEAIGFWKRGCP